MSQCPATYTGTRKSRGAFSTVFCCRSRGHQGDHRGSGKQWNQKGKKVPITLDPLGRPLKKEKAT